MTQPTKRKLRLHAFASVKGGVGKTSLAIACAKLLARDGRVPVLIDCDMTGTSFADGLDLLAPKVAVEPDGRIDLFHSPLGDFHTREETVQLRGKRRDHRLQKGDPLRRIQPPYLNDLIRFVDFAIEDQTEIQTVRVDAFLWRHVEYDAVAYLPSAPFRREVGESIAWFSVDEQGKRQFDWMQRLVWTLQFLLELRADVTDIVLDLPPGIAGLTHQAMVLLSLGEKKKRLPDGYPPWNGPDLTFTANPFLVLSPDRNDLWPGLEYFGQTLAQVPSLQPIVNRMNESRQDVLQRARESLGPALGALGLERGLTFIDELAPTLGRIFRDGNLVVDSQVQALAAIFRLEGEKK